MTSHVSGRRDFLRVAAATGAATLVGLRPGRAAAEPPPETPRLRLSQFPRGCQGPFHVAGDLLHGEGFTDVQYVRIDNNQRATELLLAQTLEIGVQFSAPFIGEIDRGAELCRPDGRADRGSLEPSPPSHTPVLKGAEVAANAPGAAASCRSADRGGAEGRLRDHGQSAGAGRSDARLHTLPH